MLNDNLQQQAQALFKAWFVDYIPWNGNSPEWEQGVLSDYVTVKRGGSPRPIQEYLSDSGYRWLKISDVTSLQTPFITSIAEHIKESGTNKTVFLKSGCLVLSNSATPGIPKILDLDSCIHDGWLYLVGYIVPIQYLLRFSSFPPNRREQSHTLRLRDNPATRRTWESRSYSIRILSWLHPTL